MKTMRNTLVVLLIVTGTSVFATGRDTTADSLGFQARVLPSIESKSFRLIYESEVEQPVQIKIKDENGNVQYSKRYQLKSFVQPFDLRNLSNGAYTFEVKTAEGKFVQSVINVSKKIEAPGIYFGMDQDSRMARLQTEVPMGTSMRMLIYDQAGEMLHQEDWVAGKRINRLYNLTEVKGKGVTFLLLHEGEIVNERNVRF